ncbi:MAG: hypothetical protein HRO68_06935 [Nitrosopumilus sp.]|nr:hypothetical protein [Nitrosopumilus sp.]
MELKLEEMNEKLLSVKKSNTIPTIHTTSTLETITSSPQDVQTLMDAVVAEFEQFVAQNPNTSGDVVNDFQQKFTASVGRLISQRNSAIKNAMDNLNPKDLTFLPKKTYY